MRYHDLKPISDKAKEEKEILKNLTYKHLKLLTDQNWIFIKMSQSSVLHYLQKLLKVI